MFPVSCLASGSRTGGHQRVATAAAEAVDAPAIGATGSGVGDTFVGRGTDPTGNIDPFCTIQFLQVEVKVRSGRTGEYAGVGTIGGNEVPVGVRVEVTRP